MIKLSLPVKQLNFLKQLYLLQLPLSIEVTVSRKKSHNNHLLYHFEQKQKHTLFMQVPAPHPHFQNRAVPLHSSYGRNKKNGSKWFWKWLEPSFNMVSKPIIGQISPCGGFS